MVCSNRGVKVGQMDDLAHFVEDILIRSVEMVLDNLEHGSSTLCGEGTTSQNLLEETLESINVPVDESACLAAFQQVDLSCLFSLGPVEIVSPLRKS